MQGVVSPAQELPWIVHEEPFSSPFPALSGDSYTWFQLLAGEVKDGRGENSGITSLDISPTNYSAPEHSQLWREDAADTKSHFLLPFQAGKGNSREKAPLWHCPTVP